MNRALLARERADGGLPVSSGSSSSSSSSSNGKESTRCQPPARTVTVGVEGPDEGVDEGVGLGTPPAAGSVSMGRGAV